MLAIQFETIINPRPKIYVLPKAFDVLMGQEEIMDEGKPTLDEVVDYARTKAFNYIRKRISGLPQEHQEEIFQNCMLRIVRIYPRIEKDGWKSFVQKHLLGVAKDYFKSGGGFEENKSQAKKNQEEDFRDSLTYRVSNYVESDSGSDTEGDIEHTLAKHGQFSLDDYRLPLAPDFDLLARMARRDEDIRLIGKLLAGFSHTALADEFGVTRERLSQRVREFFDNLDSPRGIGIPWIEQTIFALGLCEWYGMPEKDLGIGWDLEPIDLGFTEKPKDDFDIAQMNLFGVET